MLALLCLVRSSDLITIHQTLLTVRTLRTIDKRYKYHVTHDRAYALSSTAEVLLKNVLSYAQSSVDLIIQLAS